MSEPFDPIIESTHCPTCGAAKGKDCIPIEEGERHSERLHLFMETAPYEYRLKQHLLDRAMLSKLGFAEEDLQETLWLTDKEISKLYGGT
jgi:hypothetical protein